MQTKRYYPLWMTLPALILFAIFFIVPNLASFVLGFTDWSLFYFDDLHFNGIENFVRLFQENLFPIALKNTFIFAIVTVIAKNVFGFAMALMFQKETRVNSFARAYLFMPITISSMVVAIVFIAIYNPTNGVINTFLNSVGLHSLAIGWLSDPKYSLASICIMEIWQWSGFNMMIFVAGLQAIPPELYEAAQIDGAGYWNRLIHITLPLITQSITITLVFSIISGLKVFTQVYGTTNGGPANSTQVISTFLYGTFSKGYLGYSAAVGLAFSVMIMALTAGVLVFFRKREVEL